MAKKPRIGAYEQGVIDTVYYLSRALGIPAESLALKLKAEVDKDFKHGK